MRPSPIAARLAALLGALAAASPGSASEEDPLAAIRARIERLQRSPEHAAMDRVAWAAVVRLECRNNASNVPAETKKAAAALKARYPGLDWARIEALAARIADEKEAIQGGTDCQNAVQRVRMQALTAAAFGGWSCRELPAVDWGACAERVAYEKAGLPTVCPAYAPAPSEPRRKAEEAWECDR